MDGQKAVRFYFELNKQKEILSVDVGVNDCNKNSNDLKKNWCNKNIGAGSCFLILVLGIGGFFFFPLWILLVLILIILGKNKKK